jgi:hypothetical protein
MMFVRNHGIRVIEHDRQDMGCSSDRAMFHSSKTPPLPCGVVAEIGSLRDVSAVAKSPATSQEHAAMPRHGKRLGTIQIDTPAGAPDARAHPFVVA